MIWLVILIAAIAACLIPAFRNLVIVCFVIVALIYANMLYESPAEKERIKQRIINIEKTQKIKRQAKQKKQLALLEFKRKEKIKEEQLWNIISPTEVDIDYLEVSLPYVRNGILSGRISNDSKYPLSAIEFKIVTNDFTNGPDGWKTIDKRIIIIYINIPPQEARIVRQKFNIHPLIGGNKNYIACRWVTKVRKGTLKR